MSFLDNLKAALGAQPVSPAPAVAPPRPPEAPQAPSNVSPVLGCSAASWAAYRALLARREGSRSVVYLDSLGKPTVGIGHLVRPEDNLKVGQAVTAAQINAWFDADGADAMRHAVQQADYAGISSQDFLPVLGSVCFQLGGAWTTKFPTTWGMICKGQYAAAATAVAGSVWAKQTPVRTQDFQQALLALPTKR